MKNCLALAAILLLFFTTFGEAASNPDQIILIVSNRNAVRKISKTGLRNIYLGETKEWGNGVPIQPVDLGEDNELRNLFSRAYLKKSPENLKYYWVEKVFTGRGAPPLVLESEQKVREYVSAHPGAIGYIRVKYLDSTVRRIEIETGR